MKRTFFLLIVLILNASLISSGQDLKKEYQDIVIKFINCVKTDDREQIANMASYPFNRETPIPSIKSKQEFLNRFSQIFDDSLKKMIIKSNPATDWSDVGWRGIMLSNGIIWIDYDGQLIAINYQSPFENELKNKLIAEEKTRLYPSLRKFYKPDLVLETKRFRIRIDDMDSSRFRYASWPLEKLMSEKPDLILSNGKVEFEGSGGNHFYSFKNGEYTYICRINYIGDDNTPPATLEIYLKGKMILSQDAKINE